MAEPIFLKSSAVAKVNVDIEDALRACLSDWLVDFRSSDLKFAWQQTRPGAARGKSRGQDRTFKPQVECFPLGPWSEFLFGQDSNVPADEVGLEVVARFKRDLIKSVSRVLGSPEGLASDSDGLSEVSRVRSIQTCSVTHRDVTIRMIVPEVLYADRCRARTAPSSNGGMCTRKSALQHLPCSSEVVLPFGEFEIRDLKQLAIGDVLVSDVSIGSAFALQMNGRNSLGVRIGRQHNRKAAVVVQGS